MTHRHDVADAQTTDAPDRSDRRDRRDFLRKAGIGGAAAGALWAAPSVLSLDAAFAAGTCGVGTSTFAWSTGGNNVRYNSAGKVGATTTANIDVRIISTAQTGVGNSGLIHHNWMTRSAATGALSCGSAATTDYPMGNATSFYTLQMHGSTSSSCTVAGTTGRSAEVTFGFFDAGTTTPHAVRNLQFTLLDVDLSTGNYRDQVEVFVNGSGTVASTGAGGVFTTATVGSTVQQVTAGQARWRGTASSDASSTTSNVTLVSNNTTDITSVRVRFVDILGSAPQTIQWIGIGNLTFCKV